jgi:hypothetical protein
MPVLQLFDFNHSSDKFRIHAKADEAALNKEQDQFSSKTASSDLRCK